MSVISSRHWREFVLPHLNNVCTELHRCCPDAKLYCQICGNVRPILEDLVETGLDCIAPLDLLGGFSVAQARQIVGPHMVLMGGVNTLSFVRSSPAEIHAEALGCIGQGAVGGARYVLGSGCALPRDGRLENLLALRDAAFACASQPQPPEWSGGAPRASTAAGEDSTSGRDLNRAQERQA